MAAETENPQPSSVDEVIISQADPVIRKILFQRIKPYLSPSQRDLTSPEAEDVYQTIVTKLLESPRARGFALQRHNFDDLKKYAATIAHNVCNDFFRSKYPERNRLKDKLRDLIKRHPDFTSWKEKDQTLCGFSDWVGRRQSELAERLIRELDEIGDRVEIEGVDLSKLAGAQLSKVIADLFCWLKGPIEFDNLIYIVAKAQGIKDYPVESLNHDNPAVQRIYDPHDQSHEYLEMREFLFHIWDGLLDLPHNQRKAFIYTTMDQIGESLLHRMLRERIITPSQIYAILDITREDLISIWELLPMDTPAAAMKLSATTRMIAKWRHRATKKLAFNLGIKKR